MDRTFRLSFAIASTITAMLSASSSADDDWLGMPDEPRVSLDLRIGMTEDDTSNYAIGSQLSILDSTLLFLSYSSIQFDDAGGDENSQWSIFLNNTLFDNWELGIGFDNSGISSPIETKDMSLSVGFTPGENFRYGLSLVDSEVELSVAAFSPQMVEQFETLQLLTRSRQGLGLSLSYISDNWSVGIFGNYYDYEELSTPTTEEFFATSGIDQAVIDDAAKELIKEAYLKRVKEYRNQGASKVVARQRVQQEYQQRSEEIQQWALDQLKARFIDYQSRAFFYYFYIYDQQSLLSNYDVRFDYQYYFDAWQYSAGFVTYESYLEAETQSQVYVGLSYSFAGDYSVGAMANYSPDLSEAYLELSFSVEW